MKNTNSIPFRYPDELEEDFKEICKRGIYGEMPKNKALQKAVKDCADLKRILKLFIVESKYGYGDEIADIDDLIEILEEISKQKGKKDLTKLQLLKSDIKKQGRKK